MTSVTGSSFSRVEGYKGWLVDAIEHPAAGRNQRWAEMRATVRINVEKSGIGRVMCASNILSTAR